MSGREQNERIRRYLEQACSPIRNPGKREDVKAELVDHLEELTAEILNSDPRMPEDQAALMAIERMGNPMTLGKQLRRVHWPKFEWSLALFAMLLVGVGLVALYAVQLSLPDGAYRSLVVHQSVFAAVGFGVLITFLLAGGRILQRIARPLYLATVLLFVVAASGVLVNGQHAWIALPFGIMIHVTEWAPYLFSVSIAGLMRETQFRQPSSLPSRAFGFVRELLLYFLFPAILYISVPDIAALLLHAIAVSALWFANRLNARRYVAHAAALLAGCSLLLWEASKEGRPYLLERLWAFLTFHTDSDSPFHLIQDYNLEIIRNAGWWGRGFGVWNDRLPYAYQENMFVFLIDNLGWAVGLAFALLVLLFLIRMALWIMKMPAGFSRTLCSGLASILAADFVLNLLMSVGAIPLIGVSLPLVSYGGTDLVLQLAALGIILGAHRRTGQAAESIAVAANE